MDEQIKEIVVDAAKKGQTIASELILNARETYIDITYGIRDHWYHGLGIPKDLTRNAFRLVMGVAMVGTFSIAGQVACNFVARNSDCNTCHGWDALRCTKCKGTGKVRYLVKNAGLKDGEKPTKQNIAAAIVDGRAEVINFPASFDTDLLFPARELPTKDCPTCNGSGVMNCPKCKIPSRKVSMDKIFNTEWKTSDVMKKIQYPYEHMVESMEDPSVAAFLLIDRPELESGLQFDEELKQKLWWRYKEFMQYEKARKMVAEREPGLENMQEMLFAIDPSKAREDPVVIKNVPYYRARKKIEAEVMELELPPRPPNWGVSSLPLKVTDWTEDELKDPRKHYEMNTLLSGQKKLAKDILDTAWELKWREQKYDELVQERIRPFVEKINEGADPEKIVIEEEKKKSQKQKRWKWW